MVLSQLSIFLPLIVATTLGAFIGLEREYKNKPAGMKTHALVSLGAGFFMILGDHIFFNFANMGGSYDPSRILASVIVGIGFMGGGLIMKKDFQVEGLTTAAGMWIAAAVGVAAGMELYMLAFFVTLLTLFIFHIVGGFEDRFIRNR
ncbi:MAG: MgtC/SapB family protein [Patescibacteria group bacterium]|nr:MgtC/SapB family protein [Patescibacteria group bacterium]